MKLIRLGGAILVALLAAHSFGAWTWGPNDSSITDGDWDLRFSAEGRDLTITNHVSGTGDLDFTSLETDLGVRVVALGVNSAKNTGGVFDANSAITSLVAPDLVSMEGYSFRSCGKLTNLVVGAEFSSLGQHALRATTSLACWTPMTNLTAVGTYAFQGAGSGDIEPVDFVAPNLASVGSHAFEGAMLIRSFVAPKLTSISSADLFLSNTRLERLEMPNLDSLKSSRICKGCTALGEVRLGGAFTLLYGDSFRDCTSLSNVVIKAPVSTVKAGVFKNVAPNAKIVFYDNAPTFESDSLSAVNAEAGFCRARVYTVLGRTSASWAEAVAPNADRFEVDKARPDYPGERAFGLLYDGTAYSWVIDLGPQLSVFSNIGEHGTVEPAFGTHYDLTDGETVEFSAPTGDISVSDVLKVRYGGWKLYSRALDGTRTLLSEGDGSLSGSFVYRDGVEYELEWWGVRRHRVQVDEALGGTVSPVDLFVAEGGEVTLTATPEDGRAFGAWFGVPVAHAVENPLRLRVTSPLSVTPAFSGVWHYDVGAQVISNDVWRINVIAAGNNLNLVLAGADFAGEGRLLLTSFPQDEPGFHVTTVSDCGKTASPFYNNGKISAFVAPEVTSIGQWSFYYASGLETVFLSPDVATIRDGAFRNASNVKRFYPSKMPSLTTLRGNAFIMFGSNIRTSGEPHELVDFEMPALTALAADSIFSSAGLIGSFRAEGLAVLRKETLNKCTSLTNAVFGKGLTEIGDNALADIAGGATVWLPGRRAPTLGSGCIYSKDVDNRVRIKIRRNLSASGWNDVVTPLTDADRARADYPGNGTFGTLGVTVENAVYYSWVIETEKHRGLVVIVR